MHMGAEATPSNPSTTVNNCHMSVQAPPCGVTTGTTSVSVSLVQQAPPCGVTTECVTAGSTRDWGVAPDRLGA